MPIVRCIYVIRQNTALFALELKAGDPRSKMVLVHLAGNIDRSGNCILDQRLIAEDTEQSVDSVQRCLRNLERRGLIKRTKQSSIHGRLPDVISLNFEVQL